MLAGNSLMSYFHLKSKPTMPLADITYGPTQVKCNNWISTFSWNSDIWPDPTVSIQLRNSSEIFSDVPRGSKDQAHLWKYFIHWKICHVIRLRFEVRAYYMYLAWSGALLTFWSECKNLTKLSEISQMALLNSDKNVRISDIFVWNDLKIWLECQNF